MSLRLSTARAKASARSVLTKSSLASEDKKSLKRLKPLEAPTDFLRNLSKKTLNYSEQSLKYEEQREEILRKIDFLELHKLVVYSLKYLLIIKN